MGKTCQPPQLSLGLLFASATKQEMYKPLVTVDVPPHVGSGIRKVCETVVSASGEVASSVAEVASSVAEVAAGAAGSIKETVKETVKDETPKVLKTFGSVMTLHPQDIPKEHQAPIHEFLQSKAKNAPGDGLPDVAGTDKFGVPGFVAKPVAGWIGFEGDLGAVLWLDKNNQVVGAAGTIKWALPVKSRK